MEQLCHLAADSWAERSAADVTPSFVEHELLALVVAAAVAVAAVAAVGQRSKGLPA